MLQEAVHETLLLCSDGAWHAPTHDPDAWPALGLWLCCTFGFLETREAGGWVRITDKGKRRLAAFQTGRAGAN